MGPTDPGGKPPNGPLSGIVVADFSRILAGPYATMMLGDLGADVIKVESPAGDDTREWVPPRRGDVGTYYLGVNRNKRSIALDLADEQDAAVAHALSARADVFIQNFRPGGLARFGLDYPAVARRNPGIIYCSISGFGAGKGASLPGYDVLVQGVSGLMSLTGAPDTPPFRSGISVFDVFTGLHSALGILAALHHRDVTGEGQHIETTCCSRRCRRWSTRPPRTWPAASCRTGWATPTSACSRTSRWPPATGISSSRSATTGSSAGSPGARRTGTRRRRALPQRRRPQRQPRGTAAAAAGAAGHPVRPGVVRDPHRGGHPVRADQRRPRRGRTGREPRPGAGGDDGRRADRPQPDPHVRDAAAARTAPADAGRRRRRHPRLARLRSPEGPRR